MELKQKIDDPAALHEPDGRPDRFGHCVFDSGYSMVLCPREGPGIPHRLENFESYLAVLRSNAAITMPWRVATDAVRTLNVPLLTGTSGMPSRPEISAERASPDGERRRISMLICAEMATLLPSKGASSSTLVRAQRCGLSAPHCECAAPCGGTLLRHLAAPSAETAGG